jgi:hypothetical protein
MNSVCFIGGENGGITPINPWVGGDFNPYELCDTKTNGVASSTTSIVEELFSSACNPVICPRNEGDYWTDQPNTDCKNHGSEIRPQSANVPKRVTDYNAPVHKSEFFTAKEACTTVECVLRRGIHDNNLCVQEPQLPVTCNHPQGMLGGRSGKSVQGTLYHDSTARSVLCLLFQCLGCTITIP